MKPFFNYYGGKQTISNFIVEHLPAHTIYAEPYAGSAAVMFAKGLPDRYGYQEILNDIDGNLVNFYKVAKTNPEQLVKMIDSTPYSLSEFKTARKIIKGEIKANNLELAWAYFVNFNMAYSGTFDGGWRRTTNIDNQVTTRWINRKINIAKHINRLDRVQIDCVEALEFIKVWDTPNTVFYCDPPYPGSIQSYMSGEFTQDDFNHLVKTLSECQGSFILSCYENEAPPKEWKRLEINTRMTAHNAKITDIDRKRKEVIWLCDRSGNITDKKIKRKLWKPGSIIKQLELITDGR